MPRGFIIYRGSVNKLIKERIKKDDGTSSIKVKTITLQKDVLFYKNIFGKLICAEYNSVLNTYNEADCYTTKKLNNNTNIDQASCHYTDNIHAEVTITRKQFKRFKERNKRLK